MKNIWIFMAFLSVTCVQLANAQAVTLVTLGDSLTIGDGDETGQGGFPARVLALLQPSYPGSTLNNLAVSGLTAIDVINIELSPAVSALNAAPAGNRKIAFVWIGSNDLFGLYNSVCDEYYPGNYPGCEQDDIGLYQSRLATILNDLKNTGAELYIALLDDQALRPIMADAGMRLQIYSNITTEEVTRMSAQVTRYNEVIRSVAADHGAVTVDFYNTTLFSDPATLSNDGNHPNAAGYDLIAGRWFAALNNGSAPPPPPPSAPATCSTYWSNWPTAASRWCMCGKFGSAVGCADEGGASIATDALRKKTISTSYAGYNLNPIFWIKSFFWKIIKKNSDDN